MTFLQRLKRFQRWLGIPQHVSAVSVSDQPDNLQDGLLYFVGDGVPWMAALLCPCGCGSDIRLSLIEDDTPRWRATFQKAGAASLYPSIWRTKGCRSHFFVRAGRVVWARSR